MKIIKTKFFYNQINDLSKNYPKIFLDNEYFVKNFDVNFWVKLGEWFYKFRVRNSSIPTWKSWWFRIILKIYDDKVLPILIYSKTKKENVTKIEIIQALKESLQELKTINNLL